MSFLRCRELFIHIMLVLKLVRINFTAVEFIRLIRTVVLTIAMKSRINAGSIVACELVRLAQLNDA